MKEKFIKVFSVMALFCLAITVTVSCGSDDSKTKYVQPELGARHKAIITSDEYQFIDLNSNGIVDPYEDWRKTPEERAENLVSLMSIEQKAGLMVTASSPSMDDDGNVSVSDKDGDGDSDADDVDYWINTLHIRMSNNRESKRMPSVKATWANNVQELTEKSSLGIPYWFSANGLSIGLSGTRAGHTPMPFSPGVAASVKNGSDTEGLELIKKWGEIASKEYRAVGLHMPLWPQLDLATEPRWSRIYEIFGEDSEKAIAIVKSLFSGILPNGEINKDTINACVKHWPGSGSVREGKDSHNWWGKWSIFPGDNFKYHIDVFNAAIDSGAMSVMPCYSIYADNIDNTVDGYINNQNGDERIEDVVEEYSWTYENYIVSETLEQVGTGYNTQLLTGLLRETLGFTGVTYSDTGILGSMAPHGVESLTLGQRIAKSINAGMDISAHDNPTDIVTAYNEGQITEERMNEACMRIIALQMKLGLYENRYVDPSAADTTCASNESMQISEEIMKRSVVVLKNKDSFLPIQERIAYTDNLGKKVYAPDFDQNVLSPYVFDKEPLASIDGAEVVILKIDAPSTPDSQFTGFGSYSPRLDYADGDWTEAANGNNNGVLEDFVLITDEVCSSWGGCTTYTRSEVEWEAADGDTLEELIKIQTTIDEMATKAADGARLIIVVNMDRPAILSQFIDAVDSVIVNFDVTDEALFSIIFNQTKPVGTLPFELPSTQAAVENQLEDVPYDSSAPLFEYGFGLTWDLRK